MIGVVVKAQTSARPSYLIAGIVRSLAIGRHLEANGQGWRRKLLGSARWGQHRCHNVAFIRGWAAGPPQGPIKSLSHPYGARTNALRGLLNADSLLSSDNEHNLQSSAGPRSSSVHPLSVHHGSSTGFKHCEGLYTLSIKHLEHLLLCRLSVSKFGYFETKRYINLNLVFSTGPF